MKWVLINRSHINMDRVEAFSWHAGRLRVYLAGVTVPISWDDPDRELYLQMCRSQGIRPCEEDGHGQS